MFKYLASMLGLAQVNTTTPPPPGLRAEAENRTQNATCRAWNRPDNNVLLRLSDNGVVRIFGQCSESDKKLDKACVSFAHFGNTGPPLMYMRGDVPAYLSYVMGDDWRSRLRTDPGTHRPSMFGNGQVILRQSGTAGSVAENEGGPAHVNETFDEQAHTLRMRRCGAVAVRSEMDISHYEQAERMEQTRPEQLFGWPADGGVWVLRQQPRDTPELDPFALNVTVLNMLKECERRLLQAMQAIKQQRDMAGLCNILEKAGAEFYADVAECPEVSELKLMG